MISLLASHQVISGAVGMWLAATAINAMPTPKPGGSAFYDWAFKFLQTVGAAIPRLLAIYSPTTLTALTGQTVKPSNPPNPPAPEGNQDKTAS
jgi:hypothetical protein